jgi:uncharacterized protein DUF5317
VWLLLLTFGAAALVVVLTFGSFTELTRLHFTAAWLLFLGLGIQIALEFVEVPKDQIETVGYGVLMASYALILAFCLANLSIRGFGVIAVGIAMNTLVIGLNQGMPTVPISNDKAGNRVEKPIEQTVKHRPRQDDDLLPVLDDHIVLPEPFDAVVSFGDLVVSVGICELAYYGSRRRRRRGAGAKGQPRSASTPERSSARSSAPRTRPS